MQKERSHNTAFGSSVPLHFYFPRFAMPSFPGPLIEIFPALSAHGGLAAHGFVRRVPGIDVSLPKEEVLQRLAPHHDAAVEALGFSKDRLFTAQQVHGAGIAIITRGCARHSPDVDGLITDVPGVLLGIHVADCGPVYIIDPVCRVIALLHSGKKGTELGIAPAAIRLMSEKFGSNPETLTVQLGPCIRVPQYDVDFASRILEDCRKAGVPASQVHDCGTCTARFPDKYYSYRREMGKTGRLLALLGLHPSKTPGT
jgi:copper oxidase (laccase) domain-containing protein